MADRQLTGDMIACVASFNVLLMMGSAVPLLMFYCTIKSRSSLLAPAHPGGHGKRAVYVVCVAYSTLQRRMQLSTASQNTRKIKLFIFRTCV